MKQPIVQIGDRLLLLGGGLTGAASLLHVAIIFAGPDWYSNQLKPRMTFRVISSLICVCLGVCYAAGAATVLRRTSSQS